MSTDDFKTKLRKAIERFGLTDRAFASRIGFSPQYLCEVKSGAHPPSKAFVKACCDAIEMSDYDKKLWHRAGAKAHGWEIGD